MRFTLCGAVFAVSFVVGFPGGREEPEEEQKWKKVIYAIQTIQAVRFSLAVAAITEKRNTEMRK
jgi:hypothetical protein